MMNDQQKIFSTAKRVVIKVGSNVLTADHGLNIYSIQIISEQLKLLFDKKIDVVIVSSGSMAAGFKKIGLPSRPTDIPGRQATAAVGQAGLILEYEKAFAKYDKKVAQILLTQSDLNHRKRYLNRQRKDQSFLSPRLV